MARLRVSVTRTSLSSVLITQGHHKFYTAAMTSDVLAATCFVSTRYDDPIEGFQRTLNLIRAQEIADYIDAGFGTIPCSIILSAQSESDFQYNSEAKTISFIAGKKSFLILDGQHRVFGFTKAKTKLRVPVVIYENLTRQDECRIFIDINTKQRPVPNDLLLDIKRLARTENDDEKFINQLMDLFNSDQSSPLIGLIAKSEKVKGKISIATFHKAFKYILPSMEGRTPEEAFQYIAPYLNATHSWLPIIDQDIKITDATIFRAVIALFPEVAQKLFDRKLSLTTENYYNLLNPIYSRIKLTTIKKNIKAPIVLTKEMSKLLTPQFILPKI